MCNYWLQNDSEVNIHFDTTSFVDFPSLSEVVIKSISFRLTKQDRNESIPSKVKKLPAKEGKSVEVSDGQAPIIWNQGDFISYVFRQCDFKDIVLCFELSIDKSSWKELYIPYSMLQDLHGTMKVLLNGKSGVNDFWTVKFSFLIIHPWRSESLLRNGLLGLKIPEWHSNGTMGRRTLNIGHRGCGATTGHPSSQKMPTENTTVSFQTAFNNGADYVELDVHLSKDSVPVVFHDFCANAQAIKLDGGTTKLAVPLKDMTFKDMASLKFLLTDDEESSVHTRLENGVPFPSLEEVLSDLPNELGMFVEVKYPMQNTDGSWEAEYFPDKCRLVEKILEVIYKFGKDRRILLGSFDPDICIMLKLKQPYYNVVFISSCENNVWSSPYDVRCRSFNMALNFAKAESLLGISVFADTIIDNIHDRLRDAQSSGIELFTWGCLNGANSETSFLELQRSLNIAGVIYDRINELK